MADWNNPLLTSTYTNFLAEVKARDTDLAVQFDGATTSNLPNNTIRWSSSANRWQKWNNVTLAWGELTATYALTALTATNGSFTGTLGVTGAASFTLTPTAPTAGAGTNSTVLATTAFVATAVAAKADLASPTFTGIPRADTAAAATNTTQLATTAFVTTAVSTKANLASPTFTGAVILPGGAAVSAANTPEFYINSTAGTSWKAALAFSSSGTKKWEIGTDIGGAGNNNLYFYDNAAAAERARFNSLGYLKMSPTGVYQGATSETHEITGGTATSGAPLMLRQLSSLSTPWFVGPYNNSGNFWVYNSTGIGMYMANGAQVWTGTSDERLKTIIEPISDALEKVSSLRAVIGRFNVDPAGTRRSFLIAQDVQAVLPEAVDVRDDEIGTLGLAYSDVIPLLVAALKESTTRIEDLEQRLALLDTP